MTPPSLPVKLVFSKKGTKIDEIFTVELTLTTQCQSDGEDFVNYCGLLGKHELYLKICDWELIFGRAVKAISSPGVRSP